MKVGQVYGAKRPHKTQGDAIINTKPICHVNSGHISEVEGQNHGFITPALGSWSCRVPQYTSRHLGPPLRVG